MYLRILLGLLFYSNVVFSYHNPSSLSSLPINIANKISTSPLLFRGPFSKQITTTTTATATTTTKLPRHGTQCRALQSPSSSIQTTLSNTAATLSESVFKFSKLVTQTFNKSWWILPMFLALFPPFSYIALGKAASMPHFWKVVNMEYLRHSASGVPIVVGFLLSNIAYFLSGGYLIHKFQPTSLGSNNNGIASWKPNRRTMLGCWLLLAGIVSTVFHSVQALGSHGIAEELCYIDHGVAISATLYFWKTCGRPQRNTWIVGLSGIAALCISSPGYAFLHSLWHFLSAGAATMWGLQNKKVCQ